jgi:hypothetical protein
MDKEQEPEVIDIFEMFGRIEDLRNKYDGIQIEPWFAFPDGFMAVVDDKVVDRWRVR